MRHIRIVPERNNAKQYDTQTALSIVASALRNFLKAGSFPLTPLHKAIAEEFFGVHTEEGLPVAALEQSPVLQKQLQDAGSNKSITDYLVEFCEAWLTHRKNH